MIFRFQFRFSVWYISTLFWTCFLNMLPVYNCTYCRWQLNEWMNQFATLVEYYWQENASNIRIKTCPSATSPTTNSMRTGLGLNPRLCGQKYVQNIGYCFPKHHYPVCTVRGVLSVWSRNWTLYIIRMNSAFKVSKINCQRLLQTVLKGNRVFISLRFTCRLETLVVFRQTKFRPCSEVYWQTCDIFS
jgi:hypothetical protein